MSEKKQAQGANAAAAFAGDLMRLLPYDLSRLLARLATGEGPLPIADLSSGLRVELEAKLPTVIAIDRSAGVFGFADEACRDAVRKVLAATDSAADDAVLVRLRAARQRGDSAEAMAIFESEGGAFFAHIHGVDAAQTAVNLFSEEERRQSDMLSMAEAINAMKADNLAHADMLIKRRFGSESVNLGRLAQSPNQVSAEFACVAFIRGVYSDVEIADTELDFLMASIARAPANAHLLLGLFYNVALDVFVRRCQWATAMETALRARFHFKAAGAPLLTFYIDLYRSVIDLYRGELARAQSALDDAGSALASAAAASRNDDLLFKLIGHIIAYERGDAAPLSELALKLDDDSLIGEIWPSVAMPIITYGARALSVHATLASARFYLDRWRARDWDSRRFHKLIELNLADLLLRRGRVREAEEALGRIEGATADLCDPASDALPRRLDLDLVVARTRLAADAHDEAVAIWADRVAETADLLPRQRAEIALVRATSAEARREHARFREAMTVFFEVVIDGQLPALQSEQAALIHRLVTTRGNRRVLTRSPKLLAYLASIKPEPVEEAEGDGAPRLTGQEERILLLLAEGSPNKVIAARLGISLPTVRFHAKNLYRKLGCRRRADIAALVEKGSFIPK